MNIAQRLIPTLQMIAQLYYRYRKTTILWIHPFKMFRNWCLILMIKLRSKLRLQTHLLSTLQIGFQVPRGNYVSFIWSTITITYSLWFNLWIVKIVFMGTSSTWSFARRVLDMTHLKLTGSTLFPDRDNLLFDDQVYDIKWDGNKSSIPHSSFDISNLPTPDFANFMISSVKFHCGQLFYLFDDEHFMTQFAKFQRDPVEESRRSPLWFCHYLLVLAFGKFFVIQSSESQRPAGAEYFVQAMQCMPDFSFF